MEINIETLMPWGEPKQVDTKIGRRILRKAPATEDFWVLWRTHKQQLKDAGIGCAPINGDKNNWEVCWWAPIDAAAAAKEKADKKAALALTRATEAAIEIPRPDGLNFLGYQKAGIQFGAMCFKRGVGVLIGDEMGLGKTIQAIGLINLHQDISKVIIVCPNTLKRNWYNELSKWLTRKMRLGIQNASGKWIGSVVDVVIINYDIVHKFADQIAAESWDLRIIDEGHYCKNPKARRTISTLKINARRKATLTGTPIENRPIEIYSLIADLDPTTWPEKKRFWFAKTYCDAQHNGFGWDFSGHSNEAELQHRLRSSIMVRRLKCDVLTELPAKRRQVIEFDGDGRNVGDASMDLTQSLRAAAEIAQVSGTFAEYQAAVEALEEGQQALFEEMARIRHETGMSKLPEAIAFVRDSLENGKVVVFAHHLDVVHALKAEFPQAAVITGETPVDERQGEVDRFQQDPECDIFIGNNAAAEGITLTASAHVIFVEGDWVPGKLSQKEDRTHRIGQRNSVLCSYLVLAGSIDATMIQACVDKLDIIDMVLDRVSDYQEKETVVAEATRTISINGSALANEKKASTEKRVLREEIARAAFEKAAEDAKLFPAEALPIVHQGMRILAGMCNGAITWDNCGFSKIDVQIGHSFANQSRLTPRQGILAAKLCRKYRRQLGDEFIAMLERMGAFKS